MFRGFLYIYNINYEYPITIIWEAFSFLDLLFSPAWIVVGVFIIKPIYKKATGAIRKSM